MAKKAKEDTFKGKLVIEWFQDLPEPYRTKALTNLANDPIKTSEGKIYQKLHNAISAGFNWGESPEGYEYWDNLKTLGEDEATLKQLQREKLLEALN